MKSFALNILFILSLIYITTHICKAQAPFTNDSTANIKFSIEHAKSVFIENDTSDETFQSMKNYLKGKSRN